MITFIQFVQAWVTIVAERTGRWRLYPTAQTAKQIHTGLTVTLPGKTSFVRVALRLFPELKGKNDAQILALAAANLPQGWELDGNTFVHTASADRPSTDAIIADLGLSLVKPETSSAKKKS